MRRIILNLLLALSSTVLALLLWEAGLSLYYRAQADPAHLIMVEQGYESPYLFKAKPNTSILENGIEYRFNNYGMRRDVEVTEKPNELATRILSYGDSIANGLWVQGKETYAQVLESTLNLREHRTWEVLNMYRGVSPTIASFHIRRDVAQFKPRGLIIEIELLGDTADEARIQTRGRDEYGLPLEIRRSRYILGLDGHLLSPLTLRGGVIERTKTWAFGTQAVGKLLSLAKEKSIKQSIDPLFSDDSDVFYYNLGFDRFLLTEEAIRRGFNQMFDSLNGIHRFLERNDIRFLLVILPSQYAYAHEQFQQSSLARIHEAEARARRLNLPFISPYEAFKKAGGKDLFIAKSFCHPTGKGNRVIAQEIYRVVSQW